MIVKLCFLTQLAAASITLAFAYSVAADDSTIRKFAGAEPALAADLSKVTSMNGGLWIMNFDGTKSKQIFLMAQAQPKWRPDGRKIAFVSGTRLSIWIIDADGGNPHPLFPDERGRGQYPCWSSDDKRLVWPHEDEDFKGKLWIAEENGDNARPLIKQPATEYEICGQWSPDGKTIAYLGSDNVGHYEVRLENP